ncbi:MdaB protein homolog [Campylobacter sputorum subsp. bubulus]|uniref:MdaB protein homolog n=1 Tax=Campylobacter sputorum subsp. sputorum TaxID=32024 RepID=A0A381DJV0_9BACT|nr:MdaB protein homolog [Campylobacter sputorum subsp. bubulus]SUX10905.1 MdaB protein homolog [Campylobacter sputorum subsp. sputorum]
MKNILLINGAKFFGNSSGRLNQTLHNVAKQTLTEMKKMLVKLLLIVVMMFFMK